MAKKSLGKPENSGKNQGKRDKKGRFVEGVSGNPDGKPAGTLSFSTKWLKFIDEVAKLNKVKPEEINKQMLTVAYKQIMSGQFNFWKDIHDRVYGQARQPIDMDLKPELQQALEKLSKIIK